MTTKQRKRSHLHHLILPVISAAYLAYFGYHAFHGYFGIYAKARLDAEAASVQAEIDAVRKDRETLKKRVALLRPDSPDFDTVDERARQSLNLIRVDELIVELPPARTQR